MAQLLDSLDNFPSSLRGGAVAVGNFDGVHRGHARLIHELKSLAERVKGPAIVLTFNPPPVAILVPDQTPIPPLTSIRRRAELLGMLGVDVLIAYPTDRDLVNLSAEDFFTRKIVGAIGARAMVEGPNFRFGKDRRGDTELLGRLCAGAGMELSVVPPRQDSTGEMISSTRVRKLLRQGDVAAANAMLTSPYRIEGIVTKGAGRGRTLGFPTANLESVSCLLPEHGVYAGEVVFDEVPYPVAINIGPNPTFGEQQSKVELHVIDWQGSIYGERIACTLLDRVRNVERFPTAEALQQQLARDIQQCKQIWQEHVGNAS